MKNVLITDARYYLLIYHSKSFFTITQCCCPQESPCPRGPMYKSLSLTSREGIPFPLWREWDQGGDMLVSLSSRLKRPGSIVSFQRGPRADPRPKTDFGAF